MNEEELKENGKAKSKNSSCFVSCAANIEL